MKGIKTNVCKFSIRKNGRVYCKTHNQAMLYEYDNGFKICQVGEDLLTSELGGLGNYISFVNKQPQKKWIPLKEHQERVKALKEDINNMKLKSIKIIHKKLSHKEMKELQEVMMGLIFGVVEVKIDKHLEVEDK